MKAAVFAYERPGDLAAALALVGQTDRVGKIIAGGQSLGPMLNLRLVEPDLMIDISSLDELKQASRIGDDLVLGACVTHSDIEDGRIPDVTQGAMARVAAGRFGQGVGSQADALAAQADATRTSVERLRLQRELHNAIAILNTLLARSPSSPLAEPLSLGPLPPVPTIDALLDRVQQANPVLLAQNARVRSAEAERELARKDWYPDITLGAGSQTNAGSWGYAASIGIKIPLQWGALESAEQEADANLGAARWRLAASTAEIQGDLAQALAALSAAKEMGAARRGQLVPQLTAAYKSALAEYASGRGDLNPTLESVHRLHDTELELLDTDVEGQAGLAMIERLLGGSL